MWWASTEWVDVYLGDRVLAWSLAPAWPKTRGSRSQWPWRSAGEPLRSASMAVPIAMTKAGKALPAADLDVAFAMLDAMLAELPRRTRVRAWLSGGLCRPFVLPPMPAATSRIEQHRLLQGLAAASTGLGTDSLVWTDGAQRDAARLACVVDRRTVSRLLAAVQRAGGGKRLVSIQPWWSAALQQAVRRNAALTAFAAHDGDSLTFLAARGDQFTIANTLTPVTQARAADAAFARQLMSADIDPQEAVLVRLDVTATLEAVGPDDTLPFCAFTVWPSSAPGSADWPGAST